jgi:ParB family chromosome partitioning protein
MQADVESGALSLGHAKALLSVASPERRRALHERILREQLSVRAAEEAAQALGAARRSPRRANGPVAALDPDTAGLVDTLRSHLKTQVRIRGSSSRGRIEIDYFGSEELHRISEIILETP